MNLFTRIIIASLAMVSCMTSCAQNQSTKKEKMKTEKKVLVVYFSRAGENYSVGNIETGNTQLMAEMVVKETGADLFRIVPEEAYPTSYKECTEVAQKELRGKARPNIKGDIRVENYDIIFIGYPNWWGDAPMPVYTFIEKHQWKGKTVIPFCTHEGSGLSNTEEIQNACKNATCLKGIGIYGHTVQKSRPEAEKTIKDWIGSLHF